MPRPVTLLSRSLALLMFTAMACACGISGDGTGEPGPATPGALRIEELAATTVTDTTATVAWRTSEPAIGVLRYGPSAALTVTKSHTSQMANNHTVTLERLSPSTTYYYRVEALTAAGDTASRRGTPFTTELPLALRDTTPPVVSAIAVTGVTSSSARITWETDDPTRGLLSYGPTRGYGSSQREYPSEPEKYSYGHSLTLTGLTPETTYYFQLQATNPAALTGQSDEQSFATRRAPTLEFCTDTLSVAPGDTFELALCLDEVEDLAGISVALAYDPQQITYLGGPTAYRPGEFWEGRNGHLFMAPEVDDLRGRLSLEATWTILYEGAELLGTEADGAGVLCSLTCRLAPDAPGAPIPISLTLSDRDGDGAPDTRLLDPQRLPIEFAARGGWVLPQPAE